VNVRISLLLCLAMVPLAAGPLGGQQTAEELLQSAQYKQQVEGDLQGAITILQTLVTDFADHRETAASALVLLGHLHETLGSTSAQEAYRRVLSEYPDQREAAAEARARLAALTGPTAPPPPSGKVERMLLSSRDTDVNRFFDMRASPDGRHIAFTDMGYTGNLYILNLATGDTTKLADGWDESPVWSHDGKKIAYAAIQPGARAESVLTIVDVGTGERMVPEALRKLDLHPLAWAPDGDLLFGWIRTGEDGESVQALVSISTGKETVVSNATDMPGDFSPDGRFLAFSDSVESTMDVYVLDVRTGHRTRITTSAERDGAPLWSPAGDVLVYRSEKGSWAVPMVDGSPSAAPRVIAAEGYDQPAGWAENGEYFYVKYNSVRHFAEVPVDPGTMTATGPFELLPVPVSGSVTQFDWSPDMSRVLIHRPNRGESFQVYSFENEEMKTYHVGPEYLGAAWEWGEDGRRVLMAGWVSGQERDSITTVEVDLATGASRQLYPPIHEVEGWVRLSKDGRKIAFYRGNRHLSEMKLVLADLSRGGQEVVLADEAEMEDGGLARWVHPQLSPDGSQVLFGTQGHEVAGRDSLFQLWVTPADGSGEPRRIAAAHLIPYAVWNPAGTHVAYDTWEDDEERGPGGLFIVDVRTGEQHEIQLPPGRRAADVYCWSSDGKWIGLEDASGRTELWVVENILADRLGKR
jgi:Tol biopolymer transport system component